MIPLTTKDGEIDYKAYVLQNFKSAKHTTEIFYYCSKTTLLYKSKSPFLVSQCI